MNIYSEWGFQDNPFSTVALEANEEGNMLLIGREDEIKKIHRRVFLRPKSVTIEGYNGVGKTSLVNVAAYRLYKDYIDRKSTQLFIPNPTIFQLSPTNPSNEFIDKVYYSIGQALIKDYSLVKRLGILFEHVEAITNYLSTYQLHSLQGGVLGVSAGESVELNLGEAFNKSGYRKIIDEWLNLLHKKKSGVICVLDNLELVQTSKNAKDQLEFLRDELLTKNGIRWVLCGSSGIILGCASSPRLTGILHNPIEITGLAKGNLAKDIFNSRFEFYRQRKKHDFDKEKENYLPINDSGFDLLLSILNGNIRHALYYADEYCLWCADNDLKPEDDIEKRKELLKWLNDYSENLKNAFEISVSPRGRKFFLKACELDRSFSYGEHSMFDFNSTQHMKNYVAELESAELMQSIRTEEDKRRKLIQVTPKGLILYVIGIKIDRKKIRPTIE